MKLWLLNRPARAPRALAALAPLVFLAAPDAAAPLSAQTPDAAALVAVSPATPGAAVMCDARVRPITSPFTSRDPACVAPQAAGITAAGAALRLEAARQSPGSYTVAGAIAGLVIGAGATYLVLQSGESRSLCNRERNQDAMGRRECAGLVALGGVAGAGIGALIGSRIRRSR